MPGPWRQVLRRMADQDFAGFNLNRDARPLATFSARVFPSNACVFQSQPRCQAPGDSYGPRMALEAVLCYCLRGRGWKRS